MNVLVDTNVYIDYLGQKAPFCEAATLVCAAGYFGDAKLWVPAQSVIDAFYVLGKYVSTDALHEAIENSLNVFSPVDLTAQDLLRAARLKWNDFEDCCVALAAEKAKADYVVTRDTKGFSRSAVPAISPDQWLNILRKKFGLEYAQVEI